MKLNHFTDFSMRVLIFLNQQKDNKCSLTDLADFFKISRNHLIKVVQFLAHHQLIITQRGKNGGIVISETAKEYKLGNLIHLLEKEEHPIVDCLAKPCVFQTHHCKLKVLFNKAYSVFIDSLNEHTLNDLLFDNWEEIVVERIG